MSNRGLEYTPEQPSVDQLVDIKDLVIRSAVERGAFKSYGRKPDMTSEDGSRFVPKAHYAISEIDFMQDTPSGDDDFIRVRRKLAVRVSANNQYRRPKEWSLKFFNRIAAENSDGEWHDGLTRYRFEWDAQRVKLADRAIKFAGLSAPLAGVGALDDVLGTLHIPDDMASIWSAEI